MTFSQWRTELRLGDGAARCSPTARSVAATARAVGYGTPSAFIAAFRRATGSSPAAYFARGPVAERRVDRVDQRAVARALPPRDHVVHHVPEGDAGVGVGEAERAAGAEVPEAAGVRAERSRARWSA